VSGNSALPKPEAALYPASPRVIALILASAIFMEQVDSTALSTALPAMAASLGVPTLHLSMAITGYLLSLAVFIPVSGAVADRLGSRTVFRLAIGVFVTGSILCGLTSDVWLLVAARILQGMGGAMMVPVGRLVLIRSVPKSEFVAMMSWVLVPAMIGPVVGPLLSGFLVTYLSWRWIFWVNVPLGLLGIVLATLFIPEIKAEKPEPFDVKGAILSGIALTTLIFVLESLRGAGVPVLVLIVLALTGIAAALAYWRHAGSHPSPVLDFRLLRIETFRVAVTAGLMFRIAFGAFPFLLPLMMQLGFGMSALASGAITFSSALGAVLMKAAGPPLLRRVGYRNMLLAGGLISAVYYATCAFFRPEWPVALMYAVLIAGGTVRSLTYTAYGTLVYADIPPARTGASIGFHSIVQQFSVTLGVAISALVLVVSMTLAGHERPTTEDFTVTMLLLALLILASVPLCLKLPHSAGAEFSGHRSDRATIAREGAEADVPT
jgi:EmrB/QacA subfamily drug resistance transporter